MLADYPGEVRIVYKNFLIHPDAARAPAHAACAANMQGKFSEMDELLWEKGYKAGRNYSPENLDKLAGEAGLDMAKFKADMEGACPKIIQKDQGEMQMIGTRGTPAFYINGRFLSGARPIHFFKQVIDEELKKANERIAKGTPVEKYYEEWVLKKGLKKL